MRRQYRNLKRSGGRRGNQDPSKQWIFYRDMEDIMNGDVLNDEGDIEETNITMATEEDEDDSRHVENDAEIDEETNDEDNPKQGEIINTCTHIWVTNDDR